MKRTRWVFGAAVVAGVVVLVAPAVGQGKAESSLLPAGSFDPTFGRGGLVAHRLGTFAPAITGVAVQSDGKIVVVGNSLLARYLPNGSPDTGFGTGGYVQAAAGDYMDAVAVQRDGKIVVAGARVVDRTGVGASVFMVQRYLPNGSLDTSFGTAGVTTTATPDQPGHDVRAVAILPGGKIVLAGSAQGDDGTGGLTSVFALLRYTSAGALDSTFGGGVVETAFTGDDDQLGGIVVLPSGKIVATGAGYGSGHGDEVDTMVLARYTTHGSLDSSFGTAGTGKVITPWQLQYDGGPPALEGGKIVVAGAPVLARFTASGSLDTTFGKHGYAKLGLGLNATVVTQPDGKILIAGRQSVRRVLPTGRLDSSFGAGGSVSVGDNLSSLALQANGEILAGGGSSGFWTLARLLGRPAHLSRPASLGWSLSRLGSPFASFGFGADGDRSASASFRLSNVGSDPSGSLKIALTGSSAFSITSDTCAGKSLGLNVACSVSVRYAVRAGMSDNATLTAAGDGVARSLHLSGKCPAGASVGRLYWVTGAGGASSTGKMTAARFAVGCPTTVTTLTRGQSELSRPAVDGAHVYWRAGENVNEAPIGGGPVTTLATGQEFSSGAVAVDGTNVYWTNQIAGTVNAVPVGGGTVTTLATGQRFPSLVGVAGGHVYWTTNRPDGDSAVKAMSVGGGPVTSVVTIPLIWSIAVDATHVYWVTGYDHEVKEVPVGGGPVTTLASGQNFPYAVAVDGTDVYWVDLDDGTVNKVPIGGGPVTTFVTGQRSPVSIAVDATHVYWANDDGTVREVAPGGGTVHTVAGGQGNFPVVAVGS